MPKPNPSSVPLIQPYRQRRAFAVVTLLQSIMLTNDSDMLPVHRQRQVSAFPPNYVHSLDSSHMILTVSERVKIEQSFHSPISFFLVSSLYEILHNPARRHRPWRCKSEVFISLQSTTHIGLIRATSKR